MFVFVSSLEHRAEQFIPVSFNIDLEDSRPYDLSSPVRAERKRLNVEEEEKN